MEGEGLQQGAGIGGDVKNHLDVLTKLMYAVVMVLFIGFAGCFIAVTAMMVDSWKSKDASYQNLQDEVQAQNTKIDELKSAIEKKTPKGWVFYP